MHQPLGRSHLLAPWKLFTGHAQLASRSSDETSSDHDLGRLNNLIDAINEQDASSLGPSAHAASSAHHLKQSFAVSLHVLFHSHQSNSSYSIDYSVATCKGSAVTFFASSSTWESKLWASAPTSGLLATSKGVSCHSVRGSPKSRYLISKSGCRDLIWAKTEGRG